MHVVLDIGEHGNRRTLIVFLLLSKNAAASML